MPATAERNPFRPGPGTWPPVLAGRESERSALGAIVSDLLLHRADPIHLMEAPRGMGKTVLLLDLERSVPDGVEVVRASAADLPDLAALARRILPSPEGVRRVVKQVVGIGVPGLSVERRPTAPEAGADIEAALRKRAAPLLLAVDEAHALPAEVAHVLLNAMQTASRPGGSRFAVLLAGTPQLRPHILSESVNASFVERAPLIRPRLLPPAASRQALEAPAWMDWDRDPELLEEAARDSMGYPWFLQLWGGALWEAGFARRTVNRETLRRARQRVNEVRADLYARRYDEFELSARERGIERAAMLAAVRTVAPLMCTAGASVSTANLNEALDEAGVSPDDAATARNVMIGCGFLTRQGDTWRAAIPSLADHIRRHPR